MLKAMTRATATIETTDYSDDPVSGPVGVSRTRGVDLIRGDLEGKARWEGLSVVDDSGSGGFVGLSRFDVRLAGRDGSFVLQFSGTVESDGSSQASVLVLSGSGTDELAGLRASGRLTSGADGTVLVLDHDQS